MFHPSLFLRRPQGYGGRIRVAEDSFDVLPALKGGSLPERPVVLQSRGGFHALRQGEFVYLDGATAGDSDSRKPLVQTPGQLYRLSDDLHENINLYNTFPERVAEMRKTLQAIENK